MAGHDPSVMVMPPLVITGRRRRDPAADPTPGVDADAVDPPGPSLPGGGRDARALGNRDATARERRAGPAADPVDVGFGEGPVGGGVGSGPPDATVDDGTAVADESGREVKDGAAPAGRGPRARGGATDAGTIASGVGADDAVQADAAAAPPPALDAGGPVAPTAVAAPGRGTSTGGAGRAEPADALFPQPAPGSITTPEQLQSAARASVQRLPPLDLMAGNSPETIARLTRSAAAQTAHQRTLGGGAGSARPPRLPDPLEIDPVPKATEEISLARNARLPPLELPAPMAMTDGTAVKVAAPDGVREGELDLKVDVDDGDATATTNDKVASQAKAKVSMQLGDRQQVVAKAKDEPATATVAPVPLDPPVLIDVREPEPPVLPVPAAQGTADKQNIARALAPLLGNITGEATAMVDRCRAGAFEGNRLGSAFKDLSDPEIEPLGKKLDEAMHRLATIAGLTSDDISAAIAARQQDLADRAAGKQVERTAYVKAAADDLTDEAKKQLAAEAKARARDEAKRIRRLQAAMWSSNPEIVNELADLRTKVIDDDVAKGVLAHEAGATRRLDLLKLYETAYSTAYRTADDAWQAKQPADRRHAPALPDGRVWIDAARDDLAASMKKLRAQVDTDRDALVKDLKDAGLRARAALREWVAKRLHTKLTDDQRTKAEGDEADRQDRAIADARKAAADDAVRNRLLGQVNFAIAAYDDQNRKAGAEVQAGAIQLNDQQRAAGQAFLARGGDPSDPMAAVAAQIRSDFATKEELDPITTRIQDAVLKLDPTTMDKAKLIELAGVVFPDGSRGMQTRADKLKIAFDGPGTDEDSVYEQLGGLGLQQSKILDTWYGLAKGESLAWRIDDEMSGAEYDKAENLRKGNKVAAAEASIKLADGIFSNDPQAAVDAMSNLSPAEAKELLARPGAKEALDKVTHGTRWSPISGQSFADDRAATQIDLQMQLNSMRAQPDHKVTPDERALQDDLNAIAVDRTIRTKNGDGDLDAMKQAYERIRAQVAADPETGQLDADQFDNEVRRRMRGMEQAYEKRFGSQVTPGGVSALETAISEVHTGGANADLARALIHVDRAGQTSAGLQRTTHGLYASDSEVNDALQANFDKAKAEVERSAALRQRVAEELKLELAKRQAAAGRPLSAPEEEAYRAAVTDRVAGELAKTWFVDVKASFGKQYADQYGGDADQALRNMLVDSTQFSGEDEALARYENGGYLRDAQKVRFGVEGWGMDSKQVLGGIQGRTKEQLSEIATDYQNTYQEDMWARLRDEAGGGDEDNRKDVSRERFDIDEAKRGVPTNEKEALEAARRRYEYERDTYMVTAEGRDTMQSQFELAQRRFDELSAARATGDATAIRNAQQAFYRQADDSQKASQEYREQVDAEVDKWTKGIALAVAVVVAVALSGGTLGPVAIAAISSLSGTVATISTKAALLGNAYGKNQFRDDVAIGAVDLAVSMATAHVGDWLLKLPKPTGATKEALKASMKQIAAERAAKPVLARVGAQLAGQFAQGAPTAVFSSLINRQTWKGDPLGNVIGNVATSFVSSVVIGGVISHGIEGGRGLLAEARAAYDFHFGSGAEIRSDSVTLRSAREAAAEGNLHPDELRSRGSPDERLKAWKEYKAQFPDATMQEFNRALDNGHQQLQAQVAEAQRAMREMRREMLSSVPPSERGKLADTPIVVLSDAEFTARTGSAEKGQAATLVIDGKPVIVVREGAPASVLREEGIHAQQLRDPAHAEKLPLLDERRLDSWGSLSMEERVASWNAKLDLEIDAQQRLISDLQTELHATTDPAVQEELQTRLDDAKAAHEVMSERKGELGGLDERARSDIAAGRREAPEYLQDEPRLFSKKKSPPPPPAAPSAPTEGERLAAKARQETEERLLPRLEEAKEDLKTTQDDQDTLHDLNRRAEAALERRRDAYLKSEATQDQAERAQHQREMVAAMKDLREVLTEFQRHQGLGPEDIDAESLRGQAAMEQRAELLRQTEAVDTEARRLKDRIYDLTHQISGGADERLKMGGSYGEVPTQGGEVNHIPPDQVNGLKYNRGSAIWMEKVDHRGVTTTGSSKAAIKWRATQAQLIAEGKYYEAIKMDLDEIRTLHPGKYEKGIQQMLDYIATNPEIQAMNKNSDLTIADLRRSTP
jgi:hypothetical protein